MGRRPGNLPGPRARIRIGGEHSAREPAGSCSRASPLLDKPSSAHREISAGLTTGPFAGRPRPPSSRDPALGQGVPTAPLSPAGQPPRTPRLGVRRGPTTSPGHLLRCTAPSAARHFLTFRRRERPGPGRVTKLCWENITTKSDSRESAVSEFYRKAPVPKDFTLLEQRRKSPRNADCGWASEGPGRPFSNCA